MNKYYEKIVKLNLEPYNTAILCVDCQNGFTLRCEEELPVHGTDENWINSISDFLKDCSKNDFRIYASKDNHSENHMSFNQWPVHCVKGTYGGELFLKYYDYLVRKGSTDNSESYSAFYENQDLKIANKLQSLLEINEIENLIIFGLAGDVCVLATLKTALKKGYKVYIIEEFIKSVSKKDFSEILKDENLLKKVVVI